MKESEYSIVVFLVFQFVERKKQYFQIPEMEVLYKYQVGEIKHNEVTITEKGPVVVKNGSDNVVGGVIRRLKVRTGNRINPIRSKGVVFMEV